MSKKTNYITIYNFNVIDEIKEGNIIYMIDKLRAEVFNANTSITKDVADAVKDNSGRFEFYKISEENNDD